MAVPTVSAEPRFPLILGRSQLLSIPPRGFERSWKAVGMSRSDAEGKGSTLVTFDIEGIGALTGGGE